MIKSIDEWVDSRLSEEPDDILEDVKLTLENEGRFYKWCFLRSKEYYGNMNIMAASPSHWKNTLRYYYYRAVNLSPEQMIYLRRYFQWRYCCPTNPEPSPPGRKKIAPPVAPTSPQENTAMSDKLTFKTQFLLNGVPIEQHTKDGIYTRIAAEEQRLDELRKIKHQPKALKAEIEAGEAALTALVAHLDSI